MAVPAESPQAPGSRVRLSICIPTYNRAWVLAAALEAADRECRAQPEGRVEILGE